MAVVKLDIPDKKKHKIKKLSPEVTEEDVAIYKRIIDRNLNDDQVQRITEPDFSFPKQKSVLAVHWHPEFVPMPMIQTRIDRVFPNRTTELIVPTQHNILTTFGDFTGVEIDCYNSGFERKVQLLFHFSNDKVEKKGDVFRSMLAHTFRYRASQLWEYMDTLLDPKFVERLEEAADETGATEELVEFVQVYVSRLKQMIDQFESTTPTEAVRNKIIRDYFDALRDVYDDRLINHAKIFLKAVKVIVKRYFSLEYFYEDRDFIEEGRKLGAGIVIPHPEQFWPILLADLDVDGIEVWNPQSSQYTEFLVHVVNRENKSTRRKDRPLFITMGDDCHMGEKVKDPRYQDKEKASREIGVQPLWDDLNIRKSLIVGHASRENVIQEYKNRLLG